MDKKALCVLILVAALFGGCYPGGGGGRYYTPEIALNPWQIERLSFDAPPGNLVDREDVPSQSSVDDSDDRIIGGDKYYDFRRESFQGENYTLAVPIANWIAVLDPAGEVIAKLKTPRYTRYAVGIELTRSESESVFAILIDQQASSHSSTLYILDSNFTPIYKEHLLGAKWIGKMPSADGDVLYISTEEKWLQDDEWEVIGGNWRYNVFEAIQRNE